MVGGGVGVGGVHSSLSFGVVVGESVNKLHSGWGSTLLSKLVLSMLWLSSSDDEKTTLATAIQVGIGGSKVGGGVVIRRDRGLKNASDLASADAGAVSFS